MSFDVAVIVVTYNSARQIEGCLKSAIGQRMGVSQQVIVLDNDSGDETVALVRDGFPGVQLIQPGRNLGFAAGCNLAARHAEAEFLLLLNPDTVVLDHAVDKVVAFARANPGHGLYGGRTLKIDGSLEPSSCWGLPSLWSLTMFATGLSMVARGNRILDPESLGRWKRDSVREVGVVTGCFLLVERTLWNRLEGFDERYFMYGEDADLALRCRLAGFRPVICPEATVVHEVGQSSATPIHKMMLLYRGKVRFFNVRFGRFARPVAVFLLLTGVALRAVGSRVVGSLRGRGTVNDWLQVWARRGEWLGRGEGGPGPASTGKGGLQ